MTRLPAAEANRRVAEGQMLRAWIVASGRTPSGLARELGVMPSTVTAWIEGALAISTERRAALVGMGWRP